MQLITLRKRILGFTLVELIMVVSLLGIMAVFTVPNYTKAVNNSNERAASNNLMILYSAQRYNLNVGNGYQAAASNADLTANLNFTPLNDGFTYTCTNAPANTFTCIAVGATYTLGITSEQAVVCCGIAGGCPTLPNAVAAGGARPAEVCP